MTTNRIPADFDVLGAPVEGFYSELEQYWTIRPQAEWVYHPDRQWLCLGGPGVDGIEFGVQKGVAGVFAYYPLEGDCLLKADSVPELIRGWCEGTITV